MRGAGGVLLLVGLAGASTTTTGQDTTGQTTAQAAGTDNTVVATQPAWTYDTEPSGGWVVADDTNNECGGTLQSPIAIDSSYSASTEPSFLRVSMPRRLMQMDMVVTKRDVTGGPTTKIAVDMTAGQVSVVSEDLLAHYILKEIRFKVPAEHVIDGQRMLAERQAVFLPMDHAERVARGNYHDSKVIVSVLYNVSTTPSPILTTINRVVAADQDSLVRVTADLTELVPSSSYFVYPGSDSMPPCHESAVWYVSRDIAPLTVDQLNNLGTAVQSLDVSGTAGKPDPQPQWPTGVVVGPKGNARPLQPLHGRSVLTKSFYSYLSL
eukprot:Hpha_TRINITY_DN8931_c0_g1::TRINITY_DN8931_c0_g1_i1::g.80795::m.80795